VRYLDPDYEAKAKSEQGFLSKIFSSDKPVPALQYRVVLVGESANRTVVTVLGASGAPERSPAGDRILSLLNEQLR
jgi:outer membrane protein assembly factor BamC